MEALEWGILLFATEESISFVISYSQPIFLQKVLDTHTQSPIIQLAMSITSSRIRNRNISRILNLAQYNKGMTKDNRREKSCLPKPVNQDNLIPLLQINSLLKSKYCKVTSYHFRMQYLWESITTNFLLFIMTNSSKYRSYLWMPQRVAQIYSSNVFQVLQCGPFKSPYFLFIILWFHVSFTIILLFHLAKYL